MLNFYSCGCKNSEIVSPLSRCGKHNTVLVGTLHDPITKRRAFRLKNLRIRNYPLMETLKVLRDKEIKFDFICGYPNHDSLYVHNMLENGWHTTVNPLFSKLHEALTDKGHVLLVVEQTLLAKVIYDSLMSNFELNSVTTVSSLYPFQPHHEKWSEFYVYKFAVLLSKSGSDKKLPSYLPLSNLHTRLRKKFKPDRVLEISCAHQPFLHIADKTVGVCEDNKIYIKLKRALCKN